MTTKKTHKPATKPKRKSRSLALGTCSTPMYSGPNSRPFWKKINSLKSDANRSAAYALGCVLQNVEHYVLDQINHAEPKPTTWEGTRANCS